MPRGTKADGRLSGMTMFEERFGGGKGKGEGEGGWI